jgi:hypothetical protein
MTSKIYREHKTEFRREKFQIENLNCDPVGFWNIAPVWPGRKAATLTGLALSELIRAAYYRSSVKAHMVLWMPAIELHMTPFNPVEMCDPWTPMATLISGSDPIHIGYVYCHTESRVDWNTKLILDEKGKRGASSSFATKFLLRSLGREDSPLVDPFAHESATVPVWARRFGIPYIGYTGSKKVFKAISETLVQTELPFKQSEFQWK